MAMTALRRPFFVAALVAVAFALAGCPSTPRLGPPSVDRAEQLIRAGDQAGAAAVYERLASETTGSDAIEFNLRAARAWLAAGSAADAERILAAIPAAGATQQQTLELSLLRIQSNLAQGRGDQAWRDISAMTAPTNRQSAARYHETRQQVAIATGHLLDGIRSELSRERVVPPGDLRTIRAELLSQLRAAAERGVSLAPPPGSDATVRGWLEAASVALDNSRNPTLGATRINAFRARYPSHPAVSALAGEPTVGIDEPVARLDAAPHVALLLPLSGRTAAPAAQIRDGFMTAYYLTAPATRPRLRVYDTAVVSIADTIAEATANGAEFIVGPLTREEVIAAAELRSSRPPMLALNFLPAEGAAPGKFFQFALSPEDDARAVARFLVASGKRRGVVLAPEGDWGSRVAAAFEEELRAAGGYVLGQASYGSGTRNDFGASIMQVLRTDASNARLARVQATIGQKLELQPRRRPDIQFIFAPSQPATARQLRPQLRFHLAGAGQGDIPTYTLGDAYEPHPSANQEIEGVMFPDMPWMLSDSGAISEVREAANAAFGDSPSKRGRLFAFGYDAFRIALALQRGRTIEPQGLTGRLSLDEQGRVRRELDWVRIRAGAPTPLSPVESASLASPP